MRKEHGFTLIELLIVLAILGILIGVVAMSVGNLTDTALKRGLQSEWQIVQTAIDSYNTQDVIAGGSSDVIEERDTPTQIEASSAGTAPYFTKYLKRSTKYFYTWEDQGENLVAYSHETPISGAYRYSATSGFEKYDGTNWVTEGAAPES